MAETSISMRQLINFEHQCAIGTTGDKKKKKPCLGIRPLPPHNIARKIKEYDSELVIWYNRIWNKWMLFRRGHVVMTVQNMDRTYRPLDHRVLRKLRKADAYMRGRRVLDEIDEENVKVEARKEKEFAGFVEENTEAMREHFVNFTDYANDHGALNIPKEDMQVPDIETLDAQREQREAARPVNYKRKPVGALQRPE
jgi:hypothetical protein